jgi:hypothetical protein
MGQLTIMGVDDGRGDVGRYYRDICSVGEHSKDGNVGAGG